MVTYKSFIMLWVTAPIFPDMDGLSNQSEKTGYFLENLEINSAMAFNCLSGESPGIIIATAINPFNNRETAPINSSQFILMITFKTSCIKPPVI